MRHVMMSLPLPRFLSLFTLAAVISLIIPAIDSKTSVHPDKRLINMIQFSYFNAIKFVSEVADLPVNQ